MKKRALNSTNSTFSNRLQQQTRKKLQTCKKLRAYSKIQPSIFVKSADSSVSRTRTPTVTIRPPVLFIVEKRPANRRPKDLDEGMYRNSLRASAYAFQLIQRF